METYTWLLLRGSNAVAIFAVVVMGLFLHGLQANQLGLYWDEAEQFMQPLQAANGKTLKYIFWDTYGYLSTERPLAHFLMIIHRAAFAVSLPMLHWSLVALLIANAALLSAVAATISNQGWFIFAVGVVFITYPLAPLQAINPMLLPHLWSSLLALLAILFFVRGLNATDKRDATRSIWWSSMTYVASILTHEAFVLLPPAFLLAYIAVRGKQPSTQERSTGLRPAAPSTSYFAVFLAVPAIYAVWRALLLPFYGSQVYSISGLVLRPADLLEKFLLGTWTAFMPWVSAASAMADSNLELKYVFFSLLLFSFAWLVLARLIARSPIEAPGPSIEGKPAPEYNPWLRASLIGFGLAFAGIGAVALSPASMHLQPGLSHLSRVNFVATAGVALSVTALLACLAHFYKRRRTIASLIAVSSLFCIGFPGFPTDGNILSHRSSSPVLFDLYSLPYAFVVAGYVLATTLFALIPFLHRLRKTRRPATGSRKEHSDNWLHPHLLAGSVAACVFFGSLFHFSTKNSFISGWEHHKARLKQLQSLVPLVADDTFVVFIDPRGPSVAPYTTHWELSSYLLAIYDNWSVMGNTDKQLRFYRDGIESFYHGMPGTWFPAGVRGPVLTHATLVTPRVGYDRVLFLGFDGDTPRIVPSIEVKTEEGEARVIYSNLNRILSGKAVTTATWRHVAG